MKELPATAGLPGHDVTNQPPPRGDLDLWQGDPWLRAHLAAAGGDGAAVAAQARLLGRGEMREAGRAASRQAPELVAFDRGGRRLDEVRFHPAYHRLMAAGLAAGYAAVAWDGGRHATHAALVYLHSQVEPGTCCPMTMSYAAVPALAADPALEALWRPKLLSRVYDDAVAPVTAKAGATLGMAMTEKQGGSDVRANATVAVREGEAWRLTGHKWFCSAPMSDGFLTLAQAPGGLTCFLVPRWLEDRRNAIHLMRLKDKLGNRSNASAEIEYHGALAHRLGDEGQGVRTILQMVHHTRLDTALAPAGLMRAALAEAWWWARHRRVFQRRLADQPLMAAVLADLMLDAEAALALGLRVARAFDSDAGRAFARIGVALAKFLSNKLAPGVIYEAMECLGGMGYVEDTALPMLYREAPLNSIWEGSGNVICLDILRTLAKEPQAAEALTANLAAAKGLHPAYDAALAEARAAMARPDEACARALAERLATLLAAAALAGPAPAIAEAFAATRLAPRGRIYGTVTLDPGPILERFGG
jgi:putative acyl-CoA dehydrogenase